MIGRRAFIELLGAAAAWPNSARAQSQPYFPTIGFLGAAAEQVGRPWLEAMVSGLRDYNWVPGRNCSIDVRWADGRPDRAAELAAEYARQNVDIIVTWATGPSLAAKNATSTIATDPVGSGLVATLSRPGGNITGLSALNIDLVGKRFESFREIAPTVRRIAILGNVGVPDTAAEMRALAEIGRTLGLEVPVLEIQRREDIAPAFANLKDRSVGLVVVGDPLTFTNRAEIISLAQAANLPATYANRDFVTAGGLMSYGPNFPALFHRTAAFVDKILRGARQADIPVEQPTKIDLVINLNTAKSLGLDVPPTLLARADEVIE